MSKRSSGRHPLSPGAGPRKGRAGGPRPGPMHRPPDLRGAHLPPRRRPQDRELRTGSRVRHPGRSRSTLTFTASRTGSASSGTRTPEETEAGIREKVDPRYWIPANPLLVQHAARTSAARTARAARSAPIADQCADRSRSQGRTEPSATGGPADAAGIAGSSTIATKVESIRSGSTSQRDAQD